MTMLVSEKNRLVRPRVEAHIAWLERETTWTRVYGTLRQSSVWREKDDLLRTVPGVGEQISLTLLAYLPELGWTAGRSPPWWEWLPSTGTVARCGANGRSGVGAPGSALPRGCAVRAACCCAWPASASYPSDASLGSVSLPDATASERSSRSFLALGEHR